MGYFDLSVMGSDYASDAAYGLQKLIVESLEQELEEKANEYNTCGVVNVAMILDECIIPSEYWQSVGHDFKKLAESVANRLESHISECEKMEWDSTNNKEYHISTYKKLVDKLRDFAEN